jgi:hypothetical protein
MTRFYGRLLEDLRDYLRPEVKSDRIQCRGLMDLVNGQPGELQTKDESREYLWIFAHGKLCELNITRRGWLNAEREIGLLIEKYGQPSESKTAEYQNAFGAKWECLEVLWNMPDGTSILHQRLLQRLTGISINAPN